MKCWIRVTRNQKRAIVALYSLGLDIELLENAHELSEIRKFEESEHLAKQNIEAPYIKKYQPDPLKQLFSKNRYILFINRKHSEILYFTMSCFYSYITYFLSSYDYRKKIQEILNKFRMKQKDLLKNLLPSNRPLFCAYSLLPALNLGKTVFVDIASDPGDIFKP